MSQTQGNLVQTQGKLREYIYIYIYKLYFSLLNFNFMTKVFHQSHIFVFSLLGSHVTFLLKRFVVIYSCYEVYVLLISV